VRRDCAEAIRAASHALYDYLFVPTDPGLSSLQPLRGTDPLRRDEEAESAAIAALTRALAEQTSAIARVLTDPDPSVRLLSRRILENMADARRRLLGAATAPMQPPKRETLPRPGAAPVRPTNFELNRDATFQDQQPLLPKEALANALAAVLEGLVAGIDDPDVEVRRATVGVLELMGPDAAPAIPALVRATGDRDRFVRWVAGRALGRMRATEEPSILALAGLLSDPDLDVRQVGAMAIARIGPPARAATPALARAVERGDPDARIAALYAIQAVGQDALATVPSIGIALSSTNVRVRQAAAETIGKFGPAARSAEGALRQALRDTESDVRAAAGEALLSVMQPEREK
jgi:HEAT repeat protein